MSHDTAEVTTVTLSHSALYLSAAATTTDGRSLLTFDHHYSPSIFDRLSNPAVYICPQMSSNVEEMSRTRTRRRPGYLESVFAGRFMHCKATALTSVEFSWLREQMGPFFKRIFIFIFSFSSISGSIQLKRKSLDDKRRRR